MNKELDTSPDSNSGQAGEEHGAGGGGTTAGNSSSSSHEAGAGRPGPLAPQLASQSRSVPTTSSAGPNPGPQRRGRPKGSKNKYQGPLPEWRIEQLRAAGRVRGAQLKQHKEHQRKAGLARAALGDMGEIGNMGRAVQAAKREAQAKTPPAQSKAGADGKVGSSEVGSSGSPAPTSARSGRGTRGRKAIRTAPGVGLDTGEASTAPLLEKPRRGRPKKEQVAKPLPPPKEKKPSPPKEKKPPLTKEELSERGRKGLAAALARHPDLYERAGAGGLRAQQAAKERKRLEAEEQARANQTGHDQGHDQGLGQESNPPVAADQPPPRPRRRYKTKWER